MLSEPDVKRILHGGARGVGGTTGARAPRQRAAAALVAVVAGSTAVLAGALLSPERAQAQAAPTPRQQYDSAQAASKAAQERVNTLSAERRELDAEEGRLTAEQQEIAQRLETARRAAHEFVVAAYVSGTGPVVEQAIIQQESTSDVAYKSFFVKDRAARVREAVDEQRSAFSDVDQRLADFAIRRATNVNALDTANRDLEQATKTLREADAKLRASEPPPPPLSGGGGGGGSGNASSSGWAKLRQCESGGRYNAVSSNGLYRGAYQFDTRTWQSVGGSGDPAAASPAEQDYRAQILFNSRGAQPWPVCGKNLINDPNARREAVAP